MLIVIVIGIIVALGALAAFVFLSDDAGPATPPPPPPDPNLMRVQVIANAAEVFTPLPLEADRMYELSITGTYDYDWFGFFGSLIKRMSADASYYQDQSGSFTQPYEGLLVNSKRLHELDSWKENRALHVYLALLEGEGAHVSMRLYCPRGRTEWRSGSIRVKLHRMPAGTQTTSAKEAAAEAAKQAARQEEEQKKEQDRRQAKAAAKRAEEQAEEERIQAEAAKRRAELFKKVQALSIKVHQHRNWLDRKFCEEFVRQNQQRILESLKHIWEKEYQELVSDTGLFVAVRIHAPQVLDFYELRIDMVNFAERLAIMPLQTPVELANRRITARTIGNVERAISELFSLRDSIDVLRDLEARYGFNSSHRKHIQEGLRAMAFRLELLKTYGIAADTPEQADEIFLRLCPPQPILTFYEELMERIKAGEQISPDALKSHFEELHRQDVILQMKRRHLVRRGRDAQVEHIDEQLSAVRRQSTQLRDFLRSIGESVQIPDYREREESREEQFLKMLAEEERMLAVLKQKGDGEGAEQLKALMAQERVKLFEAAEDTYE